MSNFNTQYLRGRWQLPSGDYVTAELPSSVNGHFGPHLKRYILHLNYDLNVSQSLIHESLLDHGIDISIGEINNILIKDKDKFHEEKESLLDTGLKVSPYVVVDDTGARHAGKNGYCTHIGNEWFAYFKSSDNKSRINFLEILRGRHTDYILNKEALNYIKAHGLSISKLDRLESAIGKIRAAAGR